MLDRQSLIERLKKLPFPKTEYWVVAGAAMVLHGFRTQTHDIDLGCSSFLADKLEEQGSPVLHSNDGSRRIRFSKEIELFENWLEGEVVIVSGVPVVNVEGLVEMKRKLGREKDFADLALIKKQKLT